MKKTVISIILLILNILNSFAQDSGTYIGKTSDLRSEYHILDSSIRKSSMSEYSRINYVEAWVKEKYLKSEKIGTKYYQNAFKMNKVVVDCNSYKSGISDGVTYSHSGNVLKSYHLEDYEITFAPAVPNSIGESIAEYVCLYYLLKP